MAHDPYAPKRNPAVDIDDHNVRKLPLMPPAFLLRQDRNDLARLAGVAAVADEIARGRDNDAAIAEYIDAAGTEEVLPSQHIDQLDLVAGLKLLLKRLTYSEMKAVAGGILAVAEHDKLTVPGGMADALEAWSSKPDRETSNAA